MNYRVIYVVSVIMVAMFSVLTGHAQADSDRIYNSSMGFAMDKPQGWDVLASSEISYVMAGGLAGAEGKARITVNMEPVPVTMNIDEYCRLSRENLLRSQTGYSFITMETTVISGYQARRIEFMAILGDFKVKTYSFVCIKARKAYVVNMSALSEQFDGFREFFLQVMSTFRLVPVLLEVKNREEIVVENGRYIDRKRGFSLVFPDNWEAKTGFMGTAVLAYSPQEPDDPFRENISVTSERITGEPDLDSQYEAALSSMLNALKEFNVVNQGRMIVGGVKARWADSIYTINEGKVRSRICFILTKDKSFVINCSSTPEQFGKFEGIFSRVCSSFRAEEIYSIEKVIVLPGYYRNNTFGFSVSYPVTWKGRENFMGSLFTAMSPIADKNDFSENMSLTVEKIKPNYSLYEYYRDSVRKLKRFAEDFKEEKRGKKQVNGKLVRYFVCSYQMGKLKVKAIFHLIRIEKGVLVMACASRPDRFSKHENEFQEIAESLKFY